MSAIASIDQYAETSPSERREQNKKWRLEIAKADTLPHKLLLVVDLCLAWMSTGIAQLDLLSIAHGAQNPLPLGSSGTGPLGFMFLFSVLVVMFADLRGLYDFSRKRCYQEDLKLLADSVICAGIVIGTGLYLGSGRAGSAGALVLPVVLTWISMAVWRRFVRSQSIPGLTEKRNVLIVGYGRLAHLLAQQLEQNAQLGYVVKGFVSRRRTIRPTNNDNHDADARLLGTVDELPSITRINFIDEILICVPSDRNLVKEITRKAQAAGVQVRVVPDLYDGLATEQPIEYIGQIPTLTLCRRTAPTLSLMIKRLVDIVVSGMALAVLAPLFAVVALIVKLDSKGPVFYRAVRVGKKGMTFICYKFRTMIENADALKKSLEHLNERDGILFKIAVDPRVTRAGRYLRKFSIDELPQLWNVFTGEMSLVGPRPPACGEYTQYALEHLRRLDVVPGLTGLWQVTARQDPSFQNYIELDKEYVNNWTLGLDIRILIRTIGVVLAGTGQ